MNRVQLVVFTVAALSWTTSRSSTSLAYRSDSGVVDHIFDYIAHAAIWSAVSHFVRTVGGGATVAVLVLAVVVLFALRRRRTSRVR